MGATAMIIGSGETLGGYLIGDVIGIGGMAIVYRAEQLSLGREVALKVLAPEIANDEAFRARFRREGRNVAALDHPNIVPIHDSGEADGRLFLAMRLVRGNTLADHMRGAGLTAEAALAILGPIADALDVAHAAGLVHRDVKPQNILIDRDGRPYLADFGVAKSVTTDALSSSGGFVGTYNYAAPEQILGRAITPAADVYALAAVLFHAMTGRLPYPRETDGAVLHAHVYGAVPTVDPEQPGAARFDRLIARGMAKRPDDRFGSAGELLHAAAALVEELPPVRRRLAPAFTARSGAATASLPTQRAGTEPPGPVDTTAEPAPRLGGRRRGRSGLLALTAAAALAIAAGIVLVLAAPGSPGRAAVRAASGPPFTIRYARPWRAVSADLPAAFAFRGAPGRPSGAKAATRVVALASGGVTLIAGALASSSTVPAGPPPALVHRYGAPAVAAAATVAGYPGRRYVFRTLGGRITAAYVLAGRNADAAIVCSAPAGAATTAALAPCGRLAQRATTAAAVIAPGPDRGLRQALDDPLRSIGAARARLRGLAAPTLAARRQPALGLARAESHLASAIARLDIAPRYARATAGLARALHAEASAFAALAGAARAGDRIRYASAARRTSRAGRGLQTATKVVAAYDLGAPVLGALRLAGPPSPPAITHAASATSAQSPAASGATTGAASTGAATAGGGATSNGGAASPAVQPAPKPGPQPTITTGYS